MERSHSRLSWWVALALLSCASLARAQPALQPPPVPPETESAQHSRDKPAAAGGMATDGPVSAVTTNRREILVPNPPPGGDTLAAASAASDAAPSSGVAAASATSGAAPSSGASATPAGSSEPLRAFPPAPPPGEPGKLEQPTTALTSFAPAPEPPPGGTGTPESTSDSAAARDAAGPTLSIAAAADGGSDPSSAEPTADAAHGERRWTAEALVGVGVTFDNTVAGVNPLGFGFGVRADYRVLPNWSVGARMLYFVGGSVELPTSDVSMQSWLIAAEAAYAIEVDQIEIQPGLALGLHVRETDYRGFAGLTGAPEMLIPPGSTRLGLYVAPGVNISVPLGLASPSLDPLIVGADVRLDLAFGKSVTSNVELLVLAGFQF